MTGSCVVKKNKFVEGTCLIKSQTPFKFTKKDIKQFPARMLVYLPINFNTYSRYNDDGTKKNIGKLPPQYSTRASFMWYIMPMQFESIQYSMNSIISSIYLDFNNTSKYNHNDIIYNISNKDFMHNIIDCRDEIYPRFSSLLIKDGESHSIIVNICGYTKYQIGSLFKHESIDNIVPFNYLQYVNCENQCICCSKSVIGVGVSFIYDETNLAQLYCLNCIPDIINSLELNIFITCDKIYDIEKLEESIYSIDYNNFIKLITPSKKLFEYIMARYNELHYTNNKSSLYNKFPKKIIITNKSYNYVLNYITLDIENLLLITETEFN
jgi:hypothetical protein